MLWAFSFSFIGVYLSGQVDSYFMVLMRLVLAAVAFLPFVLRARVEAKLALQLMWASGAVQLGDDVSVLLQQLSIAQCARGVALHHLHPALRHPDARFGGAAVFAGYI